MPVLAFFEMPQAVYDPSVRPGMYRPKNDEERAAIQAFMDATRGYINRRVKNLRSSVPAARIVDLPGAGHFVFQTREAEVVREIGAFIAGLQ